MDPKFYLVIVASGLQKTTYAAKGSYKLFARLWEMHPYLKMVVGSHEITFRQKQFSYRHSFVCFGHLAVYGILYNKGCPLNRLFRS